MTNLGNVINNCSVCGCGRILFVDLGHSGHALQCGECKNTSAGWYCPSKIEERARVIKSWNTTNEGAKR